MSKVELLSLTSPIVEPQALDPGTLGRGRVKDRPGEEDHTTLPIDRGEGQGTAGNKIADHGWLTVERWGLPGFQLDNKEKSVDDEVPSASESSIGDGIVALEEYRGFSIQGFHARTSAEKKDLFVYSEMPGNIGIGHIINLPLPVHSIFSSEYIHKGSRKITINSTGIENRRDQCALWIKYEIDVEVGYWGNTQAPAPPLPSFPCATDFSKIYYIKIVGDFIDECPLCAPEFVDATASQVVGHEAGHGINLHTSEYSHECPPPPEECIPPLCTTCWTIMVTRASISEIVRLGVPTTYCNSSHDDLPPMMLHGY